MLSICHKRVNIMRSEEFGVHWSDRRLDPGHYFRKIAVVFLSQLCMHEAFPNMFLFCRPIFSGWMVESDCMEGRLGA